MSKASVAVQAILIVSIVTVVSIVLLESRSQRVVPPTLTAEPPPSIDGAGVQPTTQLASEPNAIKLPGPAFDLAFSPSSNEIWLAVMHGDGPDELIAIDPASAAIAKRLPLPDVDYNGFTSRVKVGPNGDVWVSEPYALTRYDADGSRSVAEFGVRADEATTKATDAGDPFSGTWISGFGFVGGEVWVGRVNVPYMVQLNSTLEESGRLPFDGASDGPTDITESGNRVFVATGVRAPGTLWEYKDGSLAVVGLNSALEFVPPSSTFGDLGISNDGLVASLEDGVELRKTGSTGTKAAIAANGDVIVFDPSRGAIVRLRNGSEVSQVALPIETGTVWNPLGQRVSVRYRTEVSDLVVDQSGTVWYLSGDELRAILP